MHSILYSFLPFLMLAITNILLILFLYKLSHVSTLQLNASKAKKQKSLNITVISLTLIFIVMTSPSALCSIYFEKWIGTQLGAVFITLSDCICFSYHGLNFALLFVSNKKFLREVVNLVRCSGARGLNTSRSRYTAGD